MALREPACVTRGDAACEYVLTWTDPARFAAAGLAGLSMTIVLGVTQLAINAPTLWLLVPAAMAAGYSVERWRVGRAHPRARAESAVAFRWLVADARPAAVSPTERTERDGAAAPRPAPGVQLERQSDGWRIEYDGQSVLLRHSRGLALLAHLIQSPGQDIHVSALDAITPSGGSAGSRSSPAAEPGSLAAPGDAGEVLDARARREYQRRLVELREQREDAEARRDLARADEMRAEIELLEDELRAAVGLGGRVRRAAADAERLRVAITQRIRSAIAQIAKHHPPLGAHLTAGVSTGYRCMYDPAAAARATYERERKA